MKLLPFNSIYACLFMCIALVACDNDDANPEEDNPLYEVAELQKYWQYIESDEMFSRNGSTTGFLASLNNRSKKMIIYLQGGGACFNDETCNISPEAFGTFEGNSLAFTNNIAPAAIFNRISPLNPYRNWNYIYVPYSTGDIHSGNNVDGDVPNGPQNQLMVGEDNFNELLEILYDYYQTDGIDEIILTGSSAGGYGVYLNVINVLETFTEAKFTGIVDSGPVFFDDTVFPSCLANQWEKLYRFNYPDDYDELVSGDYGVRLRGIYEYLSVKYPDANFGLISDTKDIVIRYFYGYGLDDCDPTTQFVAEQDFEDAIYNIQRELTAFDNWNVYFEDGILHTFLGNDRTFYTNVNGKPLMRWLTDIQSGTATDILP